MCITNLRNYVISANPEVNTKLRNGEDATGLLFDELFTNGDRITLFRLIPAENLPSDDIIRDYGYLSFTTDPVYFINKVDGNSIACLELRIDNLVPRIIVNNILNDVSDEGEVILRHGLELKIEERTEYRGIDSMQNFLDSIGSSLSGRECAAEWIESIIHCRVTLIQ